jgi:hypothetical protein
MDAGLIPATSTDRAAGSALTLGPEADTIVERAKIAGERAANIWTQGHHLTLSFCLLAAITSSRLCVAAF